MIQEGGYVHFDESDIDARLKIFWDAYTWELVPHSRRAGRTLLDIGYVKFV